MTTGHVYIATTLDGFVAREDHRIDWLNAYHQTGEDLGYDAFMESVDGLVMGRNSFQTVLSFGFWPYKKPVIVLSQTLASKDIPETLPSNVEVSTLSPTEIMADLKKRGWSRVYVDGGRLVQSFTRLGLIEDYIVTTVPILIGRGCRLFGELNSDVHLECVSTAGYPSGLVQTHYRVSPRSPIQ